MTETATAWDTYAQQRPERRATNARGETTWFNWTPYEDHGPGAELLAVDNGARVLDLGCGKGGNTAHLAAAGLRAVGVDVSREQLRAAHDRWGQLPGLELIRTDAVSFLKGTGERFDAIYSVYGAIWFTDPAVLLPVVRSRLSEGGRLVFSQRSPVPGCYGCQASYIPRGRDEDPLVVKRWDYEPEVWEQMLTEHGFADVRALELPAPPGPRKVGTLIVEARA